MDGTSTGSLALFAEHGDVTPILLPVRTVADKCVWSPSPHTVFCAVPQSLPAGGGFLDAWYRGQVHTADQWWQIDTDTGASEMLFSPDIPLDVQDPIIDPQGQYIIFKNAADQSLWALRIAE